MIWWAKRRKLAGNWKYVSRRDVVLIAMKCVSLNFNLAI
jgi:hypothetical protein